MNIYEEVEQERSVQDKHWGYEHDAHHTAAQWVALICYQATKSVFREGPSFRRSMIAVAALAIRVVEMYDDCAMDEEFKK